MESFDHCVPYDKKGAWWTAYSGKAGVHPHAFDTRYVLQSCNRACLKPQVVGLSSLPKMCLKNYNN